MLLWPWRRNSFITLAVPSGKPAKANTPGELPCSLVMWGDKSVALVGKPSAGITIFQPLASSKLGIHVAKDLPTNSSLGNITAAVLLDTPPLVDMVLSKRPNCFPSSSVTRKAHLRSLVKPGAEAALGICTISKRSPAAKATWASWLENGPMMPSALASSANFWVATCAFLASLPVSNFSMRIFLPFTPPAALISATAMSTAISVPTPTPAKRPVLACVKPSTKSWLNTGRAKPAAKAKVHKRLFISFSCDQAPKYAAAMRGSAAMSWALPCKTSRPSSNT